MDLEPRVKSGSGFTLKNASLIQGSGFVVSSPFGVFVS